MSPGTFPVRKHLESRILSSLSLHINSYNTHTIQNKYCIFISAAIILINLIVCNQQPHAYITIMVHLTAHIQTLQFV